MVQMNQFARYRCREQTYGHQRGKGDEGGGGMNWEIAIDIYTVILYKIDY